MMETREPTAAEEARTALSRRQVKRRQRAADHQAARVAAAESSSTGAQPDGVSYGAVTLPSPCHRQAVQSRRNRSPTAVLCRGYDHLQRPLCVPGLFSVCVCAVVERAFPTRSNSCASRTNRAGGVRRAYSHKPGWGITWDTAIVSACDMSTSGANCMARSAMLRALSANTIARRVKTCASMPRTAIPRPEAPSRIMALWRDYVLW